MNKLYFEYYVPFSCTFVQLHSVIARIFCLFFLLCIYMSCNNIVITMGGQLR